MAAKNRRKKPDLPPPRLLATWQRLLLWIVWLFFVFLIAWNSDKSSMGCAEGATLIGAIAVSVWCRTHPYGIVKVVIRKPEELIGEFASRTSWPWLLFSAFILLSGIAMCAKLIHDLSTGITTWGGVFADIGYFFLEWFTERASSGVQGDVTHTQLYILVILVPIGLCMVWYNARPLMNRGRVFRVNSNGTVTMERGEMWTNLNVRNYAIVCADGVTIDFRESEQTPPAISLPQWRVFWRERNTEVPRYVLALFFRRLLEKNGFSVETRERPSVKLETSWIGRRLTEPVAN